MFLFFVFSRPQQGSSPWLSLAPSVGLLSSPTWWCGGHTRYKTQSLMQHNPEDIRTSKCVFLLTSVVVHHIPQLSCLFWCIMCYFWSLSYQQSGCWMCDQGGLSWLICLDPQPDQPVMLYFNSTNAKTEVMCARSLRKRTMLSFWKYLKSCRIIFLLLFCHKMIHIITVVSIHQLCCIGCDQYH